MEGLVSLLLFAGVFYLMMRSGCGAHMVHGGHGKQGKRTRDGGTDVQHVDPVCGMNVDPEQGYGKMHVGELYRFCSRNCLDKFDAEPDTFVRKKGGES